MFIAGAVALAAVAYGSKATWMGSNTTAQTPPRPLRPVSVEIARAEKKRVPVDVDAIGTVTPISSVALKSRVETTIVDVHFEDGAQVKEGDLLFHPSTHVKSTPRSRRQKARSPRMSHSSQPPNVTSSVTRN